MSEVRELIHDVIYSQKKIQLLLERLLEVVREEQVLSMVKTIGEMADTMDTMAEQSLQSKEEKEKEEGSL